MATTAAPTTNGASTAPLIVESQSSFQAEPGCKVIRRNGSVTPLDATKIVEALTKAFLAVEGSTAASSRRVHDIVEDLTGQVFAEAENPFPWISEAMDLKKEKNFFETRVIEYQNGGALAWD